MHFASTQRLDEWAKMLHDIYGRTQNYGKTEYELYAHLAEVTGAFGKYLFKRKQPKRAIEFLPKIFAWSLALYKKAKGNDANVEQTLLVKYPRVCPYCCECPCSCWKTDKPSLNETKVRELYYKHSSTQRRGLNDFQLMFREIYENSWLPEGLAPGDDAVLAAINRLHTRLVEELSEMAEALRFYHLYPSNVDNEFADLLAWWFAIVSTMHMVKDAGVSEGVILAEDLMWRAYPGYCPACMLSPCDCRPGPIRELLSKPSLIELEFLDGLTQASNRARYDADLERFASGHPIAVPISCIRIDVDDFKSVNDRFGHSIGDDALRYLVTVILQKIRARDRVYRVGGDEFAVLCPDLSLREAEGMMARVRVGLAQNPFVARLSGSNEERVKLGLSIGISECGHAEQIRPCFQQADEVALMSKKAGKNRTTLFGASAAQGE